MSEQCRGLARALALVMLSLLLGHQLRLGWEFGAAWCICLPCA